MDNAFYAPDPRPQWKQWLQQKLFPRQHFGPVFEPYDDPAWAPGECSTHVHITACWRDRLRLLISGRCEVQIRMRTDVPVGRIESRSNFTVQPPGLLDR